MSQSEQNRTLLLTHLAKMPAGRIYLLAQKQHILGGLDLCRRLPIKDVNWSDDSSLLSVEVQSGGFHEVSVRFEGERPRLSCDCPEWTDHAQCPHAICVLASLKKAVSPEAFISLTLPEGYLRGIRASLGMRQTRTQPAARPKPVALPPPVPFALVLVKKGDSMRMMVTRDGAPVSTFTPGLTPAMRDYLRDLSGFRQDPILLDGFSRYFGQKSTMLYREGDREVPLVMERKGEETLSLHLDLRGGVVGVRRSLGDGTALHGEMHLMERHLVDLRSGRVTRLRDDGGSRLWEALWRPADSPAAPGGCDVRPEGGELEIGTADFNRRRMAVPHGEGGPLPDSLRLLLEGMEAAPANLLPGYRLHARNSAAHGECIELRVEGEVGGVPFIPSPELFRLFTSHGLEQVPPSLRTKRRTATLYEAFFEVTGCVDGVDLMKTMRARLNGGDFIRRTIRQEFMRVVEDFARECGQMESLLLAGAGEWILAPMDRKSELKLLEAPWALFGPGVFSASTEPGVMQVSRDEFMAALPELHGRLAPHGFRLFYDDRPVVPVRWEISLDATMSSLDWFEIRPEIRCDGMPVDEAELAEALKNNGVVVNGPSLRFLEEGSGRALQLFAEIRGKEKDGVTRIPRLRILDWLALRREGVEIRLSAEDERVMESLFSFDKIPRRPLPDGLGAPLRHYQEEGYAWLGFLYEHRFGACLADDMGLGKTIQAISFLAGLREGKIDGRAGGDAPHLVVVPPSILFNWESELARFYPDFRVTTYRGKDRRAEFQGFDVVLTSYDIVRRDIERLEEIFFHVLVFDEAQSVKNIRAETTSAVRRLKGDFRLALTGTPVENHLGEYCSIMELAVPGLLGNSGVSPGKRQGGGEAEIGEVARRTRPFVLRRSKEMIAEELPPRVESDIYLDLTPRQKALYTRTVAEVRKTVDDAYREMAPGQARIIALTAILKLRQICLATRLLLPGGKGDSPKTDFLVEQLRELMDEGHSVLVFSQFTSFLDIVEEEMKAHGIGYFRLDGSTPVARRRRVVNGFQTGNDPSAFLLSLKAGGRGLNLTRASYVFHLDPWWNPAVENQASDRAHRIGQTSKVNVMRLLMRHTVEEKMMLLKERKLGLYRALLEGAEKGGISVTRDDFLFLLEG